MPLYITKALAPRMEGLRWGWVQPEYVFQCPSSLGLPQPPDSQRGRGVPGGPLGHQQPEWVFGAWWARGCVGPGWMSIPAPCLCAVLTVLRAFPCRSRLGDADTAAMEEEVKGCSGWDILGRARVDTAALAKCPRQLAQSALCANDCANDCV